MPQLDRWKPRSGCRGRLPARLAMPMVIVPVVTLPLASVLLMSVLLLLGAGPAAADFDRASYQPATLAGVLKEHGDHLGEALADEQHVAIEAAVFKYRVLVVYQGERRKLGPASASLIGNWGRSMAAVPREYLALFTQEIAVAEETQSYWMPLQAQLVPFVDTELAAGDPIYVYVVFIGVGGRTPVFLVNEFQKARVQ